MRKFLWVAWSTYFLNGLSFVVFGAVMPMLLVHYETSYTAGGVLVFLQNGGYLLGVAAASWLPHRFGVRLIMSVACVFMACAQIGLAGMPPYGLAALLAAINGVALSCTETTISTKIMEVFEGRRAVIMSRLEAAFGFGALVMPLVASFLIANQAWSGVFWVVGGLALCLGISWWAVPSSLHAEKDTGPRDAPSSTPLATTRAHKGYVLTLFLLMMFVYVGVEASLNSFLPSMFITRLGERPGVTSLSVSTMWGAMVIGRMLFGWVARTIPYARYLAWTMGLTFCLLVGLTFSNTAWAAYPIVFGIGLMMSGMFALILVYANHAFPGQARLVTSLLAGCAGVGGAIVPALTGYAMDHLAVVGVMWCISALVVLMIMTLFLVQLRANANAQSSDSVTSP